MATLTHRGAFVACAFAAVLGAGCSTPTAPGEVGVARHQLLLVPSEQINQAAEQEYQKVLAEARSKNALDRDPQQVARVKAISSRLIPQTGAFRNDAPNWKWEVHVLSTPEVNAWCMPGGKIAVYSGLIEKVQPTDAELAAVIGHEIGHALREHSRERVSIAMAEQLGVDILSAVANVPSAAAQLAPLLLDVTVNLPHSRGQETEADRIGVELAARAGYDPHAAISLWQKMEKVAGGQQPPKWLSTHPPSQDRIRDLQQVVEKVAPLYQAAARR